MTPSLIVDTSALVAMARADPGFHTLRAVFDAEVGALPAPALVEFHRVMAGAGNRPDSDAVLIIEALGLEVLPFDRAAADAAAIANERFGSGNGRGGPLNLLDLMVYGMARSTGLSILCTGRDFAATDARLHSASRRD